MSGRWVVLGAGGMLGHDLLRTLHGRDAVGLARRDVDITDEAAVLDAVAGADVVVNCAAWTAVVFRLRVVRKVARSPLRI